MPRPNRPDLPPLGVLSVGAIAFTAMGLTNATFGPTLPELARHTTTSLTGIGALFSAFFLGAVASQSIAGPLADRIGQRPLVAAGMLALGGGALGVSLSPVLALLLLSAALAGVGSGTLNVSTNLLIAGAFPTRGAAALNMVAVFYGLGAIGGPALAAASLEFMGSAVPVLWVGAALAVLALPVVGRLPAMAPGRSPPSQGPARPVYRDAFVLTMGALLLLYGGIENGVGAWTTTYFVRTTGATATSAALVTSSYWFALTLGRVLGAALGRYLADARLQRLCVAGCVTFGALLALSVGHPLSTRIAVLGLGLSFGPFYPTTLALTTASASRAPGAAVSLVAAMSSSGAMLVPWLEGMLLEKVSPAASVGLVAAIALLMLLLQLALVRPAAALSVNARRHA